MLHHRHARIVALIAVERGEPEESPATNLTAEPESPRRFAVARGVSLRREYRNYAQRGRRRLFYPLCKRILRAPEILPIEERPLPVKPSGAAHGFHVGATAGVVRRSIQIAGRCLHLANSCFAREVQTATGNLDTSAN